jgi:hypothetical protein
MGDNEVLHTKKQRPVDSMAVSAHAVFMASIATTSNRKSPCFPELSE